MKPFKFFLITDTHYFSEKLPCHGEAYNEFMRGEQKCFAETSAINKAAFAYLGASDEADTVLIAGDLSFNGEKESHLEFVELLRKLKADGKKIYVITAGHDCNEHPFAFDETGRLSPEGTKKEELYELYYEFGFSDALSVHKESLSYVSEISEDIWLFALNNDGDKDYHHTYTASQRQWIAEMLEKGKAQGKMMFVMNHYPLIPACPIFRLSDEMTMKDHDEMTTLFADGGAHLGFTGHMHNQSIKLKTTQKGNKFWDVCTGSLIGCPAFMRLVEIKDKETAEIKSIPVPDFQWDKGGLTHVEYLKRQFDMMINSYLDSMENDPERLMRKLSLPDNDMLKKILPRAGAFINHATLGSFCKKFLVKCPASVKDRSLKDFLLEVVRNVFTGNAPYTEDTDEYKAFMGVISRFSPVLAIVKKKVKVKGEPLDVKAMLHECLGNYGVDEYNTVLKLG